MSKTMHARRARRPEHGDDAPRRQPRPLPRRGRTRRQAVLMELRLT